MTQPSKELLQLTDALVRAIDEAVASIKATEAYDLLDDESAGGVIFNGVMNGALCNLIFICDDEMHLELRADIHDNLDDLFNSALGLMSLPLLGPAN